LNESPGKNEEILFFPKQVPSILTAGEQAFTICSVGVQNSMFDISGKTIEWNLR
jgi:hypothetical protein